LGEPGDGNTYTLLITTICLFIFYFTKKYKPFYIATALLLLFNIDFIMGLPYHFEAVFFHFYFGALGFSWPEIVYFLIGLWAVVRSFKDLFVILKGESVVESWNFIVEQGAGKDKWILDTTQKLILEAKIPDAACYQKYVKASFMSPERNSLIVSHIRLTDYKMYIFARNFGTHLDIGWFGTIEPRFLKRTLSKYAMGNPQALSGQVDMFDQQDLRACFTIAHHCLERTIDILLEELKQEPLGLRGAPQSKGFLNVW
jgi:hypothetical protein